MEGKFHIAALQKTVASENSGAIVGAMEHLIKHIDAKRGRLTELARALGITPAAIKQWSIVPADKVVAISAYTGIPRQKLRPDLYVGMMEAAE